MWPFKKKEEDPNKCKKCGKKLEKFGNYLRCSNCETFCKKCGNLRKEEDTKCKHCGIVFEENNEEEEDDGEKVRKYMDENYLIIDTGNIEVWNEVINLLDGYSKEYEILTSIGDVIIMRKKT